MARRKPLGDIIRDLRAAGWKPSQISKRTGVSTKTQNAIVTGKTSGSTYEDALRRSNRYDRKGPPADVQPLKEAEAREQLKDLQGPVAEGGRSRADRLTYRQELKRAKEAAKARGEKFSKAEFDKLVYQMSVERKRYGKSRAGLDHRYRPDGPLARYRYMTGATDRILAVES